MAAPKTALPIKVIDVNCFELDKLKKGKMQQYCSIMYNNHMNNSRHALMFKFGWFTMVTKGIPYLDSVNPHPESAAKGYYPNDAKRCFARLSLDENQPALAEARELFYAIDEWAESDEVQDKIRDMLKADELTYSRSVNNYGTDEKPANDMVKIKFDTLYDPNNDSPKLTTKFFKDGETTPYKPESISELEEVFTWNSEARVIVCPTIMWFRPTVKSVASKVKGGKPEKKTIVEYGITYAFKRVEFTTGGKDDSANVVFGDEEETPVTRKSEVVKPKKNKYDSDEEDDEPKKKSKTVDSDDDKPKKKSKAAPPPDSDEEEDEPKPKKKSKAVRPPPPDSDEEDEEEEEEVVAPPKKSRR